jgi:ATPase family associated with various cellular activities (AAA)
MNINIVYSILEKTKAPELQKFREHIAENARYQRERSSTMEVGIPEALMTLAVMTEIMEVASELKETKTKTAIQALIQSREGKTDIKIPNFKTAGNIIGAYLAEAPIKGWIFKRAKDGKLYPKLITKITVEEPHRENAPKIKIHTASIQADSSNNRGNSIRYQESSISLTPSDVVRKKPSDALAANNLFRETAEFHAEYEKDLDWHKSAVQTKFGSQFVMTGTIISQIDDHYQRFVFGERFKVVHNLQNDTPSAVFAETTIAISGNPDEATTSEVPLHLTCRVFDLRKHVEYWIHSSALKPYVYNPNLRSKLILTDSHRDMLDILTQDPDLFLADSIEGKGSGNIILCKGVSGVGKTLTPEIYSEIIQKPLLPVHSGILGTDSSTIEKNLQEVFRKAELWQAVLLIDEADIFVSQRGQDLEHNAIVAVFLRTLEYFKGLFFMTTNRPDDIDEAILSRCAAIIHYPDTLEPSKMKQVWEVLAGNHNVILPTSLLEHLLKTYPKITPRDVRMLLRLALKVARHQKKEMPDPEIFRQCAMFRALPESKPNI